jgi:tetratricopeptide (TPR) repeat protein
VFLDEERRGVTPVELKDVEAGPHALRILKEPLYRPVAQDIELKEGESRRVAVRLESDLETLLENETKKHPTKLSNYTELLHVHIGNGEVEKAAATVAQAMAALGGTETQPTALSQFFEELRKLFRGQAGPLDAQSRQKVMGALTALLEKLVLASPSEYLRYGPIVSLLSQGGEFDEVYKICEKTVQSPTGRGAVHYYVATVCLGQGDTKNAIRLLERAAELQPALYTARVSLGSAYQRAERYDDALRQYTEAEKHIPASSPYYQGLIQAELARLMVARKDIEGAIARYKRAIAAGAPEASACQWRLQFAELLLEQGRKAEATEQYQQIVKLADPDSTIYRTARIALRRLGEK